MNAYNFPGVAQNIEMSLQTLCRGFLKFAAGQGENEPGKISDNLHYLALYTYGLIKSVILSPNLSAPLNSVYLDMIADLKFKVNTMSPEEVLPMLHPQIYQISNVELIENEFPAVSQYYFNMPFRWSNRFARPWVNRKYSWFSIHTTCTCTWATRAAPATFESYSRFPTFPRLQWTGRRSRCSVRIVWLSLSSWRVCTVWSTRCGTRDSHSLHFACWWGATCNQSRH